MSLAEKNKEDIEELKYRVTSLEDVLGKEWVSTSDDESDDDDDDDEDIQQLKDVINRLDAQAGYYATKQQLDEVAQLGRDNEQRLNVIEGQIDDLEDFRNAMEADRDALEARIVDIEEQRSGTGGTGGGKRRKRTRGKKRSKSRKKRRKKKTKKRRKKKTRKRRRRTRRKR